MIRYADDLVIGFRNRDEAEDVLGMMRNRLAEYGLTLHPDKTRIVRFGRPGSHEPKAETETFDFLGFTMYWRKSRKGMWVVGTDCLTYALLLSALATSALLGASGCARSQPGAPDSGDSGDALIGPLRFTDISDQSPDLASSPYGGAPGWDHSDKYAPGIALVDLDGDDILDIVQPRNDRQQPALRSLRIYRRLGDGRFEDATGVVWDNSRNATVALAFDHDGDGDLDIYSANAFFADCVLANDGRGLFTDVAPSAGVLDAASRAMGVAVGDLDLDGDLDVMVTDTENPDDSLGNALFLNRGNMRFTSSARARCGRHGRAWSLWERTGWCAGA